LVLLTFTDWRVAALVTRKHLLTLSLKMSGMFRPFFLTTKLRAWVLQQLQLAAVPRRLLAPFPATAVT
jgi:hypothetical protein